MIIIEMMMMMMMIIIIIIIIIMMMLTMIMIMIQHCLVQLISCERCFLIEFIDLIERTSYDKSCSTNVYCEK